MVWIREGWSLEKNWKIKCGWCEEDKAGAWKKLEYQLWIREGWILKKNWKIKCGKAEAGARQGTGGSRRLDTGMERNRKIKCG
jgi:hypothetical protein